MLRIYEAWGHDSARDATVASPAAIESMRQKGLLSPTAKLLYRIQAHTWEEAMAIHHLRMGWEPYQPVGSAEPCPRCGARRYPEGSGQCWQCGEGVGERAV